MSGFSQTLRNFRNIWNHGDDEYLEDDEEFERDEDERDSQREAQRDVQRQPAPQNAPTSSTQSRASEPVRAPSDRATFPQNGGGTGGGNIDNVKRLRPVSPALRAREKNIYALRPRSQEEAVAAADALKTGDAVIINLEEVPRGEAIRIIDFMSGVCYGLDHQGHAMKLGDLIFLYTPGDFEISSDESDYGENNEPFFMDEGDKLSALSRVAINNPRVIPVVAPETSTPNVNPQVASQMAQMQAQAAQTAAELTAASAQVVPDPQLQAQRDAIRAAQNARSQSLPAQPLPAQSLSAQSSDQAMIDNAFATSPQSNSGPLPRAIPAPIGGHLTAQGYISPSAPMPRAASSEETVPMRVRRPWER